MWEILVSLETGHKILSEQKEHDAVDGNGEFYEYKVARNYSWNFEDISPNVLSKFKKERAIILATINKKEMKVVKIYSAEPHKVIKRLEEKLEERRLRFLNQGKTVRRLQVSLSLNDLARVGATQTYPQS